MSSKYEMVSLIFQDLSAHLNAARSTTVLFLLSTIASLKLKRNLNIYLNFDLTKWHQWSSFIIQDNALNGL